MNSTEYIIKPDLPRHLGKVDNFKKRTREVTNSPSTDQTQDGSTKTILTRNRLERRLAQLARRLPSETNAA